MINGLCVGSIATDRNLLEATVFVFVFLSTATVMMEANLLRRIQLPYLLSISDAVCVQHELFI